mgnify:CR=1 FL=1
MLVYGIHSFSALVFAILLLLPFQALRMRRMSPGRMFSSLKPWKWLLQLAHVFLIISLVTGLLLRPNHASTWFWVVILVFILLGASLGFTAKALRQVMDTAKNKQPQREQLQKLTRASLLLAAFILVMLLIMVFRW